MEEFKEAEVYDSNSSEQVEEGLTLMKHLALKTGSKILDLGCGTGYLTKVLAERVGPEGKVCHMEWLHNTPAVGLANKPSSYTINWGGGGRGV